MMRRMLSCSIAIAFAAGAQAAPFTSVDDALAQAKKTHQPVLIDFSAPWCYSCYFMATHVLNGSEWDALEKRTVVAEVDADSPTGSAWMKKLTVKALPAYVVLNPDGVELGRILGEKARASFYPTVDGILAGSRTLDQLKADAAKGKAASIAAVLASYEARKEGKDGLDWYATLPEAARKHAGADASVALWRDRLTLDRALRDDDHEGAIAAAVRTLDGDVGCDRPYVVDDLLEASESLPKSKREALLAKQRPALEKLLDAHVFVAHPDCADQRSAVITTADVDAALGDAKAETAVLDRGIAAARRSIGGDLSNDRNAADNLRVYLIRAKRIDELDALYPKLIKAYPDDYVYAYRWGRSLLDRDQPAKALPPLEDAAEKSYGENRLIVATLRVKALKALGRPSDAKEVAAEALEQNGQWFPELAGKLKAEAGS